MTTIAVSRIVANETLSLSMPPGLDAKRLRIEVRFGYAADPVGGDLTLNVIRASRQNGVLVDAGRFDPSEIATLVTGNKAHADYVAGHTSTGRYDASGADTIQLVNHFGADILNVNVVVQSLPYPVETGSAA